MPNGDPLEEYRMENAELRERIKRLEHEGAFDVTVIEERDRYKKQCEVNSYNLIELTTQRDMLSRSLASALNLATQLMDDLRTAGITPSMASVVGKAKLDAETRALIARYGSSLGYNEKP